MITEQATPGPWEFIRGKTDDGEIIYSITSDAEEEDFCEHYYQDIATIWRGGRSVNTLIANAKLIAAAPCLLEALQYAVSHYGKPGGPWNVPGDPGGWLQRARAAIAKATGDPDDNQ